MIIALVAFGLLPGLIVMSYVAVGIGLLVNRLAR